MPMPRSFGSSQVTFLPLMKIWPSDTSSRPAMQLSKVDLPQPEGPSSTRNSPFSISRSSDFSTSIAPKLRDTLRRTTLAMTSAFDRAGCDTAHEELSGDEVDDEGDEPRKQRGRHVHVVLLHALDGIDDVVELDGHRIGLRCRVDHAEEEVVPDAGDLDDERHHEDRQRH